MSAIRLLIKPTLFTFGFSGACYCTAAIWSHENNRNRYHYLRQWADAANRRRQITDQKFLALRQRVNEWKNNLTQGEKIAAGTIFINAVVLAGWRLKSFRPVMTKFFLSHTTPTKVPLTPMVLSCFSHSMPLHFALNMYVLYSFSNFGTSLMGPEKLIALFLSAGVYSSFVSIAYKLARGISQPSLGASGALFGVIGYICTVKPETQLLVFFIPVEAGNAIKLLMATDVLGMILRWKMLDHAAHLGGAIFGIWFAKYGEQMYNENKKTIVKTWLKYKPSTGRTPIE